MIPVTDYIMTPYIMTNDYRFTVKAIRISQKIKRIYLLDFLTVTDYVGEDASEQGRVSLIYFVYIF